MTFIIVFGLNVPDLLAFHLMRSYVTLFTYASTFLHINNKNTFDVHFTNFIHAACLITKN